MIAGDKNHINMDNIDLLVKNHMAFIIRTLSRLTGNYISIENDEIFSVGLDAFVESVERFNPNKGNFLPFAKLVIESRAKTFLVKENKITKMESLEQLNEEGVEFSSQEESTVYEDACREEMDIYKRELLKFGLTLEDLADNAPKHNDTKANGVEIARRASLHQPTVDLTYKKRKLPIRAVARVANVTEKVVKGSKYFILSALLIFVNKLPELTRFIQKRGEENVL